MNWDGIAAAAAPGGGPAGTFDGAGAGSTLAVVAKLSDDGFRLNIELKEFLFFLGAVAG